MASDREPIRIDGALGGGGGQVLRTALALAAVSGRAVELRRIRAGHGTPGLLRRHLAAVRAAVAISGGTVAGDVVGSTALDFSPGEVRSGDFHVSVGVGEGASLLLQTVLPALMVAEGPSTVVLEGGTHSPGAPPFEFLEQTLLPTLGRLGPRLTVRLDAHGFEPAGGGRMVVEIEPAPRLERIEILERGALVERAATVKLAQLPRSVGERMRKRFTERSGWSEEQVRLETVEDSRGPGTVLLAALRFEAVTEIVASVGQPGRRPEAVADRALKEVRSHLKGGAAVGVHLADQLIVPMALADGGAFRTRGLSLHARAQIELVRRFSGTRIEVEEQADGVELRVEG